jgi:pimeloyl-ACP methyl ester carboxylesterase
VRIEIGGVGLNVAVEGHGPPVVLLHGWPDSHRLWRHQVPALTTAGFRVVAPDLRGFGASDRPTAVDAYGLALAVGDLVGMLDHLGLERAHIIGHDWGAAIGWLTAALLPDRVDHLVALSAGHPRSFRDAGLPQREKSWYMLLFQFDDVAEKWLSADDWANFRQWSRHPDPETAIADLSRPGALTASLNWYRANVPPAALIAPLPELPPVAAPTMGVWSSTDPLLTEANMTGSQGFVSGPCGPDPV